MTRRMGMIAAASTIVLAAVAGWFRPLPPLDGAASTRPQQWRLPAAADLERSSAAQFVAISDVRWLGEDGSADGGPGTQWTLLGVVGTELDRAILVKAGSDPLIKRLHSGDTLPDGSKLVAVGSSGIVIDRDGCRTERPLYPSAGATVGGESEGEGCLPPGDD